MKLRLICGVALLIVASAMSFSIAGGGGGGNFDKLMDADRKAFQDRFTKDIWPLLHRGGKDSCTGCHNGSVVSALKFAGNAEKDFPELLKDGFFIPDDTGSLLTRILSKNKKQMMPPPGKASPWKQADIDLLQNFVDDLEKKQQKK